MKRGFMRTIIMTIVVLLPMVTLMSVGSAVAAEFENKPDAKFLVSCSGVTGSSVDGVPLPACNWCSFVKLIGNMVQSSIYLSVILSALMFAYAGFLFLTNNGKEANITKAWSIFRRSLLGTVAILAAWLIVNAIMTKLATGLGLGDSWNSITGCSEVATSRQYTTSDLDFGDGRSGSVTTTYPTSVYDDLTSGIDGYLVDSTPPGVVTGTNTRLATDRRPYTLPPNVPKNVKYSAGRVALKNAGFKINDEVKGRTVCKKSEMSGTCFYGIQDRVITSALTMKQECDAAKGNSCNVLVTGGSEKALHSPNSKHYKGQAIDFSVNNSKDFLNNMQKTGEGRTFTRATKDRGGKYGGPTYRHIGTGMLCVYESSTAGGHIPHVHCEY